MLYVNCQEIQEKMFILSKKKKKKKKSHKIETILKMDLCVLRNTII